MKKIWIVAALAVCAIALAGCKVVSEPEPVVVKPEPVAVESVTLNATTLTLEPGKTMTLTATVTPDNADVRTVAWSSSDTAIATVSEDGTVTAVSIGEASITAQAGDKEATCTVTVKQILIAVENVTLDETTLTLMRGDTGKLTATVTPDNADDKTVLWSSSDTAVATVDNDGTVTAVSKGTATITAQTGDKTATCAVTVKQAVENVALEPTSVTLEPGMTRKLTATVMPDNADDKTVKWTSSNADIATVGNDGTVTAVKKGDATITAQAGDKQVTCLVTVRTEHSYSGGKCTVCGAKPKMDNGTIDDNGILTKYSGSEATVAIPDGVTGIGESAFLECTSLESVTIPDGVTSIEDYAFWYCTSLASVTIPDSVMSIGKSAFSWCENLTNVEIPGSVTSIGDEVFYECKSLESVTISNGVRSIGNESFYGCENLTNVTIPDGVMSIGDSAFYWCTSLTSVEIPTSVTSIGISAFWYCTSLASVTYGGTLAQWCALDGYGHSDLMSYAKHVTMGDGTDLKQVTTLVIPDGVTSIGYFAFSYCNNLTSVTISDSVTSIGWGAFSQCKNLTSVTISDSVTSIGKSAFSLCKNLTNVEIPDSVTSIGSGAFKYCTSLTSMTIPDGVTTIENEVLSECTSLKSVTIPASVTSIGDEVFYKCTSLTAINYTGTEEQWNAITKGSYWDYKTGSYTITYNYTE